MFVRNHMLPLDKLTGVRLDETLDKALIKLKDGDFMSLPVVEDGYFKGILMRESIYRMFFECEYTDREKYLQDKTVKEVYKEIAEKIDDYDRIDKASYLLKELRTPFLPVYDISNKFVGILTHFAIFNAFTEVFGMNKGSRIVVNTTDMSGQLAKLTEILRKEDAHILNFAVLDAKMMGIKRIVLRVDTKDLEGLVKKIEKSGFKVGEVEK